VTLAAVLADLPLPHAAMIAALLGLIAGSFIATLVLRWGVGKSVLGRSRCDDCARELTPVDLVPIIGWLRARGRCRSCGVAINPLHMRVEIGAAAIGALGVWLVPGVGGWLLALFGWLLLPLALLDARHFWLPDILVAVLALPGLLLAGPLLGTLLSDRLIGAVAGGLTLAVLRTGYMRLRGREGMGEGDPKLAAALGAWLGWQVLPLLFLLASAAGIVWAQAVRKKEDVPISDRHVPFGSFLAGAAWIAVPLWPLINA
jgi:leader peptidase (prepilin peptidase) / N-methyltransferase